ncbi:sporulation histidine kinase inhibitor Sda [Bacillus suaedae]|uniref:Sporulation histidine kinase inhibitor Sda n=1 Tax=Halalkalibacter suaedae TaxID=2822140 RepID=A0A940WX54_9BACI|nr:sporulation histidine kinase inhibitor Sda [Bacillus suaedae]MBP3949845.1 sporulation histidine kinase inhibitor Sda [Bacillus suaedae]
MNELEYEVLIEAYERAVNLELEEDFIGLLKEEIEHRNQNQSKDKSLVCI